MLSIESTALAVDVLPEVGGKLAQIRDRSSGREFLVSPQRPYRTIPLDGDWLAGDTSGMDDCFPNIAAGPYPSPPWNATALPDLGEWTHGSWDVTESDSNRVSLERSGYALPYWARKVVRFVDAHTLEFSYRVENRSDSPLRYMWSAHPLIAVQDCYELRLPAGELSFRTFPGDDASHKWPLFGAVDLSKEWISSGTSLKIFISGLTEGRCALRLPEHTLTFTFDYLTTPIVGVWYNNFGFPESSAQPFRCIAVEPCTSPSDLLDELPAAAYPCLGPQASTEWSLLLEIKPNR